jgi:threonine/homoserine/homoserine lactone efflux protein
MKYFRSSLLVLLLFFIIFVYAANLDNNASILFALFFAVPGYIIYLVYSILRHEKESKYELKDGWYENL